MDLTSNVERPIHSLFPISKNNKLFQFPEGSLMGAPYRIEVMAAIGFQTYHTFSRNMKLMLGPRGLNSLGERNNVLLLLGPL